MIAKAAHEDHEVFYIRGFVYFRATSWLRDIGPIRSAEASMIFFRCGRDLAQIDPGMPQRIDDGRRRAIDWHLANALGAERAVFVRILEHHDVDRRRVERRRNDVVGEADNSPCSRFA